MGLRMPTPSPSPYQNLTGDMQTADSNTADRQSDVDDAQARFDAASKQYHATNGIPEKAIYDKSLQDLFNAKNAQAHSATNAREIELQRKMGQPKIPTQDFITPEGGQGIEFNKGLEMQAKPKPTSQMDLTSLLKMAGNAIYPSSEAAEMATGGGNPQIAQDPKALGLYSPPNNRAPAVLPPTSKDLSDQVSTEAQSLRGAGFNPNKAGITQNEKGGTINIQGQTMSPEALNSTAEEFRGMPEWQRQVGGLDDLDNLLGLQAKRNANKSSVDLSPLGAYLDYSNAQNGFGKTDIAGSLKGEPIEDTSFKDMGDIQRRRADLSKELINAVKASKFGTINTSDLFNDNTNIATQPLRPVNPNGAARLDNTQRQQFTQMGDKVLENSNKQKAGLDSLGDILQNNRPASIGRIPLKRAVADVAGNGRVNIYDMFVESGSQAFYDKHAQELQLLKDGKLGTTALGNLTDSLYDDIQQWKTDRTNKINFIHSRAPVYNQGDSTVKSLYPDDYAQGSFSRSAATDTPAPAGTPAPGATAKAPITSDDIDAALKAVNSKGGK